MSVFTHFRKRRALCLLAAEALEGPEREAVQAHVAACASCRRELDDLLRMMALLGLDPVRAAEPPLPVGIVRARVLARIDEVLRARASGRTSHFAVSSLAAVAAAFVAVFFFTRPPDGLHPPAVSPVATEPAVSDDALRRLERNVAREQAARYLSEAQDVLVTMAASPRDCDRETGRVDVQAESERSRELLHRRALLLGTDTVASARPLLEDVDLMLREVAALESCVRVRDVERLQEQMERRQLLMKMRLLERELLG